MANSKFSWSHVLRQEWGCDGTLSLLTGHPLQTPGGTLQACPGSAVSDRGEEGSRVGFLAEGHTELSLERGHPELTGWPGQSGESSGAGRRGVWGAPRARQDTGCAEAVAGQRSRMGRAGGQEGKAQRRCLPLCGEAETSWGRVGACETGQWCLEALPHEPQCPDALHRQPRWAYLGGGLTWKLLRAT